MPTAVSWESGLLVIAPAGPLTKQDILQLVLANYPAFTGTRVLWDLSAADLGTVTTEDFAEIAQLTSGIARPPGERRTAYATADRATFIKIHKYMNEAVKAHVSAEYAVFRTAAEARDWLTTP